jgi:penicillin-binding protein 1A
MRIETSGDPQGSSRRGGPRRLLALAVGGLAAVYALALVVSTRPSFQQALRDRIERTLRARLGPATVGGDVSVDPLFRVSFGPVEVPGTRPSDPPVVRIDRVRVRARLVSLLTGHAEPASIKLYDVRVEAGPDGRAIRELAARMERPPPRRAPGAPAPRPRPDAESGAPEPVIQLRRLTVHVTAAGRDLEAGPFDATIARTSAGDGEAVRVDATLPGGGAAELGLVRDGAGWRADARLSGVGPAALPSGLLGTAVEVTGGTVSGMVSASGAADLGRADGRVELALDRVVVDGARVGEPLGPLSFRLAGALAWDGVERRLALRDGTLSLTGAADASLSAELRLGPGAPFAVKLAADGVDFGRLVAALPPALQPPEAAPRPSGRLAGRLELAGPLVAPAAWTIDAALDLGPLREAARRAPPVALRGPFRHHPDVERGLAPVIEVGPVSPDFVPVAELPNHVIRAVTASEDAGFFAHPGFDFEELKNAFAQGAEQGRVVRGGSTITQQLAKNLYLSREKTVVRKLREALVTVALEATVPKQRLLEIYLNVAEWGPGLWGIGPAARHWFGKDARELTPREAAFLATVIPNPVRYHYMWDRGAPSDAWNQRVDELLLKMNVQGVIADDVLLAALAQPLAFANPQAIASPDKGASELAVP